MFQSRIDPQEVQYMGLAGMARPSLLAVDAIVNSQHPPRKASVVTWMANPKDRQGKHLFLFWDWNEVDLTVVQSGFTSGYDGEGPRSYSQALCMILDRGISTNEIRVAETAFNAIEHRRMTTELAERLRSADDTPAEWLWISVWDRHETEVDDQTFWKTFHSPKPDFDFLDPELSKRCRSLWPSHAETAVFEAFRIVEERLRALVGESSEGEDPLIGEKLITRALNPKNGILIDTSLTSSEREGLYLMFKGAYQFVRNPRAHRIVEENDSQLAVELLYHADLLLRLLPNRPPTRSRTP